MSVSVRKHRAWWMHGVAVAALMIGAPVAAFADDLDRPAVTPLDLSPPNSAPAPALDTMPTGALPEAKAAATPLDLSPPPGLLIELPSEPAEAARPSYVETAPDPRAATQAAPAVAPPEVAPAAVAEARPEVPAAEITPPVEAPVVATPRADVGAEALHAALDGWLAARPTGRPIGMGDWEAARRAISKVYSERAYAPLWIENGALSERAQSALARLARVDDDGLGPAPVAGGSGAQADIALSAAVVAYAMQASGARIVPRLLTKDVTAAPPVVNPAAALKAVADASDPGATLEAFNPPHPEYRALRSALADLRAKRQAPSARLPGGPALKLGMSDPRVPLIRARFGLGADPAAAQVYDVRVASAVTAFQRSHGLQADGMLTSATADAISGGSDALTERRLLANMEMWRWLPRDLGDVRVEVNIPDFSLKVTSGGAVVHRARIIVGKPATPTPVFSNAIRYLLVNPAWHVPDSIIKKEMAPRLASDPNYFERHGFKVSYAGDRLVVEQPPGEANALGRILFLFPNEHAVYLHDTPQRYLFGQSFRAFSHGCVRVEDPAGLAELLMGGAKHGWSQDKIRSLLGDRERTYALAAPVPVHLEYFTEIVDARGALESREDLYGLTGKVISALQGLR